MTTRILGIESSCDETAAAVVADGREILSSVVASQIDIHRKYGGVVPELASREHLRSIVPVVREALERAGHGAGGHRRHRRDLRARPGRLAAGRRDLRQGAGASLGKPLIAVNHLEGHVRAVFLEAYRRGQGAAACRPSA